MSASDFKGLIDLDQPSLWLAAAAICFNPTFWNTAARTEYRHKTLTKTFGGPYYGCYVLAVTIFSLGIIRDFIYEYALRHQPVHPLLIGAVPKLLAVTFFGTGNILVLTSMYALGVTGTYLGDYFGILMDDIVTGFPFNVSSSPMYTGSTLSFLGTALWMGKPAGVALTVLVFVVYQIALRFEDPFTAQIYANRDQMSGLGPTGGKKTGPQGGKVGPQGGKTEPKGGKTEPKGGKTRPKGD